MRQETQEIPDEAPGQFEDFTHGKVTEEPLEHRTYVPENVPKPPDVTVPPPTTKPPDDKKNEEEVDRLADVFRDIFNQPLGFPTSASQPVVIPTQSTSSSVLPILLIAGGLGFAGYLYYKRKKGAD